MVSRLEKFALRWRLALGCAVPLVLMAVLVVRHPDVVAVGLFIAAVVVGGGLTAFVFRRVTVGTARLVERLDAVEQAAKANLMRGLRRSRRRSDGRAARRDGRIERSPPR